MAGSVQDLFSLEGSVAVVTGGTGVLGGAMARGLALAGAKVGVLGRRPERAGELVAEIEGAGGKALVLLADVGRRADLERARDLVLDRWGQITILVNAAGGNLPEATVAPTASVFDLSLEAWREVLELNLTSSLLAIEVFGKAVARTGNGSIVNISSASASRPLTRVGAYSAAKAGIDNLTRWLAIELPKRHGPGLRVNAIAPGFFIGDQNRSLLLKPDGTLTERGQAIIDHTPAHRFGDPGELVSTLIWLCGPGAAFVNGAVIPVDGGFGAYAGV